jgi:uncharacterized protein YbaR (Trm112 family)
MHLLLTDRLSCPRCGPTFGVILRADRMQDRSVLDGVLGCPNCRDAFPVVDGFADLRAPPRGVLGPGLAGPPQPEQGPDAASAAGGSMSVDRLRALLGIVGGGGALALVGAPARFAPALGAALPELLVVGADADMRLWPEATEVSRLVSGPGLALHGAALRGVVVDGRLGRAWLAEAARVVQPKARVVVMHAREGATKVLEACGFTVMAAEAETVVAVRG